MASKSILSFYKRRRVEIEPVEPVVEQPLAVGAPLIESEFQNQDEVVFRGIEFGSIQLINKMKYDGDT
jgi:hypothetical protein